MNALRASARLLAALADRVLATPPTTWSSASYGLGPTDSPRLAAPPSGEPRRHPRSTAP